MPKRRVRRPARPIEDHTPGFRGHLKRFFLSFTPRYFKSYWLSRGGLMRLAKLGGVGVLFIFLVFLWYAKDLPSPSKINAKIGQTTTFYARDELTNPGHGTKLYEVHGDKNRILVDFNQIPDDLKHATVAIEDRNFYKEGGFSVIGTLRSAVVDVKQGGAYQGGSTITQQYVKSSLLSSDKRISRKIKELILSIEIAQFYSKDDVLKLYLNEIPYGNGAYGIEAACRTYFSDRYGKDNCAQHLNLGESALLAGIPNLPSYYSPYGQHKQELIDRQHIILDKMVDQGYTTRDKADAAKWTLAMLDNTIPNNTQLAINKVPAFYSAVTAPNFVYTLQEQLEQKYGTSAVEEGGWKVVTTLDPNLQHCAELSIYNPGNDSCKPDGKTVVNPNPSNRNYTNLLHNNGSNAALVAADPKNGQVLTMVGSYSFSQSQVNVATSPRQPGSSFKPYVYATLFGKNSGGCPSSSTSCTTYGAGSVLDDTVTNFGTEATPYKPQDFGGGAHVNGPVTVRSALDGSLNIPAVQALKLAGISQSVATAKAMGITTLTDDPSHYGLSLVLGSGEVTLADHVNAYESFANGGLHYTPTMVMKIYDHKNSVIEDNTKAATPKKVLDPQVAYLINNILSDSDARRYVFASDLDVAGHIGHSQQGQGVAAKTGTTEKFNDAWTMGYTPSLVAGVWAGNNDNAPMSREAADIAAPIWRSFMGAALTGKPMETFAKPDGLQFLPNSAPAKQKSAANDYFPKWYKAPVRKMVTIDKVSGKLATDCTPELAKEQQQDSGITDTDDVHHCDDVKPTVQITGVHGGGPYSFNVQVSSGTFTANRLQVYFDDQIVSTQEISGSGTYPITYSPTVTGGHSFKATVTDQGLYQGSDDQAVTVTNAGSGDGSFSSITPTDGSQMSSGPVTFTWSSDTDASLYTLYVDGTSRGTTGAKSKTVSGLSLGTHTWYVKSDAGNTTDTQTFKLIP